MNSTATSASAAPQTPVSGTTRYSPNWAKHDADRMARDFMLWRHLRVIRARTMRHVHRLTSDTDQPARTVYGVKMWPNWNDRTYAYCHYGTYGSYLADLIASLDRPFAFVDIGANQGLFSLIAGQNPACEKIIALEPVPDTYARLARNFELNGLGERGTALNFGLSDQNATHQIAINTKHSGQATLDDHLDPESQAVTSCEVQLRTMEGLAPHIPAHLPIFVKIDVEGHENTVIEQLLSGPEAERIMGVFYEHDDRWTDDGQAKQAFARAGFEVVRKYGRGRHFDALAVPVGA